MNRLYLDVFQNFLLMGFFWAFFFPYSGDIEDTKSEFFSKSHKLGLCDFLVV